MALPVVLRALGSGLMRGSPKTKGKNQLDYHVISDTKQLQKLIKNVNKLGHNHPNIQAGLNKIGQLWIAKIRINFRNSVDPYGEAWDPITHREGQPLIDTGALLGSIGYEVSKTDITLSATMAYADDHQHGIGVKKRAFLPDVRGLPKNWEAEYVKIMEDQVMKALQK